jgi:hypothetical protein
MTLEELEKKVKYLEQKVQKLDDIEAIKRLQKVYGFYLERGMYQEIVDCFSDSPDVSLNWLEGQYRGKEAVKKYFAFLCKEFAPPQLLHQLMQLVGVVDVNEDGVTAQGRWYGFGGLLFPELMGGYRMLASGIYENKYVKEDGVWKMLSFTWMMPYVLHIPEGWSLPEEISASFVRGEFPGPEPQIPVDPNDPRYMSGYILPFHYRHPVTGKATSESKLNAALASKKKKA